MFKKEVMIGVAAGAAIAALVPVVLVLSMGGSRRTLGRAFARGSQVLAEKARETFAEFQEIAEDLTAEMRATEVASATGAASTAAAAAGSSQPEGAPQPSPPETAGAG